MKDCFYTGLNTVQNRTDSVCRDSSVWAVKLKEGLWRPLSHFMYILYINLYYSNVKGPSLLFLLLRHKNGTQRNIKTTFIPWRELSWS